MSRHLFIGGEVALAEQVDGSTKVDGGRAFTLWSAYAAGTGTDYTTLCTDTDGVTALVAVTDVHGRLPSLLGPDTQTGNVEVAALYLDWGAGGPRTPWYADDRLASLVIATPTLDTPQTWSAFQNFSQGIAVPDASLAISDIYDLQRLLDAAGQTGGTGLTNYSQVTSLNGYPAVVAAGATQTAARSAIGFDAAVRALNPAPFLAWNHATLTWWAWDPVAKALVNGGARPDVPICTYYAQRWVEATKPTGAQAWQLLSTDTTGDVVYLHTQSTLRP